MLALTVISAVAAMVGVSFAQTVDPNTVSSGTRSQWCDSQKTSCPLLCLQYPGNSAATTSNDCDPKTLSWSCVCAVNGMTPNASEFSQTIPYFECTEFGNQCVANCGQDNTCASNCRTQHPCGAQNPTRVNVTSTSSMAATATGAKATGSVNPADYTGLGGAASTGTASSKKSGAGHIALSIGRTYGLGMVIGSFFVGFALVL